MRWFSWPVAASAIVVGASLGTLMASEVGAMADGRSYAEPSSYASLTPQGERSEAQAEQGPVEIAHAPIYGCTNCARARPPRDAIDRYSRDYGAASLGAAGGYRAEPIVLIEPHAPPAPRGAEMAAIDLYTRYPITETERELKAMADAAARAAEARRASASAVPQPDQIEAVPTL